MLIEQIDEARKASKTTYASSVDSDRAGRFVSHLYQFRKEYRCACEIAAVRQANRTLRHPMGALAASCFNEILLQLRYKDQRDAVSYAGILRARQFSSKEVASDSEAHLVSGRIVSGLSREILFDVLRAMQGGPTMASGKRGRLLRRFYQGLPRRDRGPISSQPKPMEVATG